MDFKFCDFDGVSYRLKTKSGNKDVLQLSVCMECLPTLQKYGASAAIKGLYGDWVVETQSGYHLTLEIDMTTLGDSAQGTF